MPDLSDDQILMTQSQMRRLVDHVLREAQAGKDVGEWRQQVTSVSLIRYQGKGLLTRLGS